ncbi:MAG: hypothetical protein OEX81_02725 [Candidatus Pacebacteria bacterium]|nr:hypothetical protein [Candidatus Paceibacterota bacterium]
MKNNNKTNSLKNSQQGGYILVTLLVVAVVGIIISTTAVSWVIDNTRASSNLQQSSITISAAESGAENAILSLLRDPSYTGEILIVDNATVTITVTGNGEKTIIVQAVLGEFSRKLEITTTYVDSILTVNSWKEIS